LCSSRKYPYIYSPHTRGWKFQVGWGVSQRAKHYGNAKKAKLEFPEGWGDHRANPFHGRVWIFSGTTHCYIHVHVTVAECCFPPSILHY